MTFGSASGWTAEGLEPKANPLATILVYDYAELHPGTQEEAEQEASRIFRLAGIDTLWLHCALTEEGVGDRACERDFGADSLIIRIMPEARTRILAPNVAEFGIAYQSERGGFGTDAAIYHHRVAELAEAGVTSEAVLLGHVMAHEIGHLLLGTGHHSPRGLMTAKWHVEQLQAASEGRFLFTSKQAARMQRNVLKRSKAAAVSQTQME